MPVPPPLRIYAQKPMQSLSTALLPMAEPLLVLLMLPQITFQTNASSKALKMLMNSVMFSPQKSSPVFPKRPFLT